MHTRVSNSHICILIVALRNDEVKKKVFHFQPFSDCFQFRCKLYLCSIFWLALLYIIKMYFVFVNILGHQFHGLRKIYCFEVRYFLGVSIKSAITILCLIIIWFRWSNQQQNPTTIKISVHWILMKSYGKINN